MAGLVSSYFRGLGSRAPYYPFMTRAATKVDFGLTPAQEDHALALHRSLTVFDSLMECSWYEGLPPMLARGGTVCGSLSIGSMGLDRFRGRKEPCSRSSDWWTFDTLIRDLAFVHEAVRAHQNEVRLCFSAEDMEQAGRDGRVGIVLDTQNTNFIGNDWDHLQVAYGLGLRRVQLTYNRATRAGRGCMEEDGGLTRWGEELVAQMNALGVLVDTGHCAPQTVIGAARASKRPIACSHAGMKSRVPTNPRTQTDEALKAVAESGGVFGVVSAPGALVGGDFCTVAEYVDTIDAAVKLVGEDHVGFGTDFIQAASLEEIISAPEWSDAEKEAVGCSGSVWPWSDGHTGMENASGYVNLTRGLVAKGYPDSAIHKIMGGNFIRLYRDVAVQN